MRAFRLTFSKVSQVVILMELELIACLTSLISGSYWSLWTVISWINLSETTTTCLFIQIPHSFMISFAFFECSFFVSFLWVSYCRISTFYIRILSGCREEAHEGSVVRSGKEEGDEILRPEEDRKRGEEALSRWHYGDSSLPRHPPANTELVSLGNPEPLTGSSSFGQRRWHLFLLQLGLVRVVPLK